MEDLPFADYIFVAIPPERLICSNKYSTLFVIQLWLALHDIPFVGMIPTSKSLYISKYSIFMSVPWHPQIGIHGCWWRTEKKKQPSHTWPWSVHSSGPTWGMLYPQPSLRKLLFSFRKFDQPQAVNLRINKDCSLSCRWPWPASHSK